MTSPAATTPALTLASAPLETIVEEPIRYLKEQGYAIEHYTFRALSDYGMGNPVIFYQLYFENGARRTEHRQTFVAKWYEPERGERMYQLMRALYESGFTRDEPLSMPEPWAFIRERHILLQTVAAGGQLADYLDDPSSARARVRLAARWLGKLHTRGATFPSVFAAQVHAEIARAETWGDLLSKLFPHYASRLNLIRATLQARLVLESSEGLVPTHGDYHPKNIYIAGARVSVIDLDRFAMGYAERDVGYFIAQSRVMCHARTDSYEKSELWVATFLKEYARSGVSLDTARLGAYTALAFLEVLGYVFKLQPVKDEFVFAQWLEQCQRALDGKLGHR